MGKYRYILLLLLFSACAGLKNSHKTNAELVLFTVSQDEVLNDEFRYVYSKNSFNNDSAYTKNDIQNYLDLYINFKLKVKEAIAQGYDTTASFKQEFEGYKKQLAKPYLTEDSETDRLVKEAYERLKTEISAAHILLQIGPDALPEDTLKVYNRIIKLRNDVLTGEDFGEVAMNNSEDPSAKSNQGNLGYFSAMQMVYPFENGAFNTPIGNISMPVRSSFGYHLIKVNDKRPSVGEVSVSHIMIIDNERRPLVEQQRAEATIREIHTMLKQGEDWDMLCKQYSSDRNTSQKGGTLPKFGRGKLVPEFEAVAFEMAQTGQISEPVKTAYGWHIIKLNEKFPLEPFEEIEESIESKVKRDARASINKEVLEKRLKNENNYISFNENITEAITLEDSTYSNFEWKLPKLSVNLVLFSIGDSSYNYEPFYEQLKKSKPQQTSSLSEFANKQFKEYRYNELLAYEEAHLVYKHEDFRRISQEYHDGILLFSIMEENVWNKAVKDSVGMKDYFEVHRNNYKWDNRANASIFKSNKKEVIDSVASILKRREVRELIDEKEKQELLDKFNATSPLTLQISSEIFEKGDEALIDKLDWVEGDTIVFNEEQWCLIRIHELWPESLKKLGEIRGSVIADYQDLLEKEFVVALKEKYEVKVKKKSLKKIYVELEK